jgi:hypothetical protein
VTLEFSPAIEPFREVGGYRVVRQLAAAIDGITLLVHDDGQPFIARVVSERCPPALIDEEVAVSDAVRAGPDALRVHVGTINDLGTTPDGRLVVFSEYVEGPRLDDLLHERMGDLRLGEAVTLLAPLATAIDEGHRVGVTGLVRGVMGVRLRRSGAPVLVGLRGARVGAAVPERFQHRDPAYETDRERWQRIGAAVAEALPAPDRTALLAVLGRHWAGLDRALFQLAEPLPVGLARVAAAPPPSEVGTTANTVSGPVERVGSAPAETPLVPSSPIRERVDSALSALDSLGLPASVVEVVRSAARSVVDRISALTALRRRVLTPPGGAVRSRYRLIGIAGAAALVATVVVAGLPSDDQGGAAPEPAVDSSDAHGPTALHDDSAHAVVGLPETALNPEPDEWRAIVDDLVERWVACGPTSDAESDWADRTAAALPGCAAEVVHAGSAAARLITVEDDRHRLLSEWSGASGDIVVVERMGSAVLIDLLSAETTTASLLIVRSEAGWRIRDVIG